MHRMPNVFLFHEYIDLRNKVIFKNITALSCISATQEILKSKDMINKIFEGMSESCLRLML